MESTQIGGETLGGINELLDNFDSHSAKDTITLFLQLASR